MDNKNNNSDTSPQLSECSGCPYALVNSDKALCYCPDKKRLCKNMKGD